MQNFEDSSVLDKILLLHHFSLMSDVLKPSRISPDIRSSNRQFSTNSFLLNTQPSPTCSLFRNGMSDPSNHIEQLASSTSCGMYPTPHNVY
jgi:hypothetical protein